VEIMSDKKEENYVNLFKHLEIVPEEFLMIGNSFKSDILPVINLGGRGIYIPYHVTWQHEKIDDSTIGSMDRVKQLESAKDLMEIL
jgi:putative hydrolase of the HAD superfamily